MHLPLPQSLASKSPSSLLGYDIERDRDRRLIKVTNVAKINEIVSLFPHVTKYKRNIPIPTTGYLVNDYDFEQIPPAESAFLTKPDITLYMQIVGVLIWIQGVRRPDILFATLYLSWFTQKPRHHHLNMAYYCLGYLSTTKRITSSSWWHIASLDTQQHRCLFGHWSSPS